MSFQPKGETPIPHNLKELILSLLFLFLVSCSGAIEKEFDFELNSLESIKKFDYKGDPYYSSLILTPIHYFFDGGKVQEVTAGFLYKDKEAAINIVVDYETNEIRFVSIGEKSDYFVLAISELYEEPVMDPKMTTSFSCHFYDGEPEDCSMLTHRQEYKLIYDPFPDSGRGFVQMNLVINMNYEGITLGEKNSGIAKKNFVDAFHEPA